MVEDKTATGEERESMETGIGNKVQETEQELPNQEQNCAKELTIADGRMTLTNVDYVGKRPLGKELT